MSEGDVPERIVVKFIKDEPSETDFFGSHSRVSTAISDVIGEDNGINVVGLLGPWGSGKSTVVNQIQKRLGTTCDNIHFFSYDAWLYQNDPPRRSFLEALIQDLVQNALSDEGQWQDRLADLSGRSEETVTETSRKLSLTGKWIIGALALVPIGTVVLGRALDPKNIADAPWMMMGGIALTLAPVIMASIFYLSWRPWRQSWFKGFFKSEFWTQHRDQYAGQSIFALLTNQSVERAEKKTKISPEPSVTEFRAVFRDVLKSLRAKRERLVIVIDNLDRLAEPEAVELWATIRSLFLGSELNGPQRAELTVPSIILPIDEGSVQRMFQASGHGNEASDLARSFMDKTFDVSFYINDPVMSDWRDFLREKLKQAFGESATDERIYWATKIVEEHATSSATTGRVTPRSLVKLVNSVGVLVKQWGDGSINFLSMVFFALYRAQISANPRGFVNSEWQTVEAAVPGWQRDVVALHYGVPRDKAFQALLQEPLRMSISGMDETQFSLLAQVVGFGPVFEEVVASPPTGANGSGPQPDFVANAALLVSRTNSTEQIWAKRGMHKLASTWCECAQLDSFRADFASVVQALAPFTTEPRFVQACVTQLGASLAKSGMSEDIGKGIVAALGAIQESAKLTGQQPPLVQLTLDYPALFALLDELPANLRPMLRSDKSASEFVSALTTRLGNESESEGVAAATRALASNITIQFKDKAKPNWDALAAAAYNTISANPVSFHATGPSIDVLGILYSKNQNAKAHVEQLFDQGHLVNRLNEADQGKMGQQLADIAALMFLRGQDFAGPNGKSWEIVVNESKEFDAQFKNALNWYVWANPTTYAHQSLRTRPSLKPVIAGLVKRDISRNDGIGLTTDHLLRNVAALSGLVGTDLVNIALAKAAGRSDLWSTIDAMKDGRPYDDAITTLANVDAVDRATLIQNVKARLVGNDAATWAEALADGVSPYNLAEIFGKTLGHSDILGDGLKTAVSDALPHLTQSDEGTRQRWFYLSQFVSRDIRAMLFKNLRDMIQSGTEFSELPELMRAGGCQVLDEGKFDEFADKTTRHLAIPLLSSEIGLAYVSENIEMFSRCLSASDDDSKNVIRETLRKVEEEFDEIEPKSASIVTEAFSMVLDKPRSTSKPARPKRG